MFVMFESLSLHKFLIFNWYKKKTIENVLNFLKNVKNNLKNGFWVLYDLANF